MAEDSVLIGLNAQLKLHEGDGDFLQDYFLQAQLEDPEFIHLMDISDDGRLRSVFWTDSRSRTLYTHFGDIVALESRDCSVSCCAFVGINHHGESIVFGCGLIGDETVESYRWLFKTWLAFMAGRSPQTIVTSRSTTMTAAISEVFPEAHHRFNVAETLFSTLGGLDRYRTLLESLIYDSLSVEEFETAWVELIQELQEDDQELFQSFYETRKQWAPVFVKDTFLAGLLGFRRGNTFQASFFGDRIDEKTTLVDFFDIYEVIINEKREKDDRQDIESRGDPRLEAQSRYESQLSNIYTHSIFTKFQEEVVMMRTVLTTSCDTDSRYLVEDHGRDFEVVYDESGPCISCSCSCFHFSGYLCRHALCVLEMNRVEEIPTKYILTRWRKDLNRGVPLPAVELQ